MANDDAIKAAEKELPSGLTWAQAVKSHGEAVSLWQISGRVSADDKLSPADRYRLAYAISKQTSPKEESTMASTNEAATAMLADADQRQYLLAAANNRSRLQQSDTESIFDIAARLKKTVEAARAADARKPAGDATLSDTDHLAGHHPGGVSMMTVGDMIGVASERPSTIRKGERSQGLFLKMKMTTMKTRKTAIDLRRHSATVKPLVPNISTTSTTLISRGANGCVTS
jgi:hypothetical protein